MGGGNEGRGRPHRCPPQNTGWLEAGASLAGGQDPKGTVGFAGHALCAQPSPDSPLWLSFLVPTGRHRHSSPVMSFRPEGSVLCSKERRPIRPTRQQDQLQPPGSLRWSPERRRAVPPCSSRSLRSIWLPRGQHLPWVHPMSHRAGPRRSWFTHYILQGTGPLLTLPTSGHISSLDSFLTQLPQLSPLLHLSANCPFSSPPPATAAPSLPATVLPAPHHCPAPRNSQISPAFFFSSPLPRTHTSRRRPSPP